jgi:hypothetical protein
MKPENIEIFTGDIFIIDIFVTDLTEPMTFFVIQLPFDPDLMEIVSFENHAADNGYSIDTEGINNDVPFYFLRVVGPPFSEDALWTTLTFRCKSVGTYTLGFIGDDFVGRFVLRNEGGDIIESEIIRSNIIQLDATVGGYVTSTNKLAIVAPYLVLAGLIIAVSAIVIKKRK